MKRPGDDVANDPGPRQTPDSFTAASRRPSPLGRACELNADLSPTRLLDASREYGGAVQRAPRALASWRLTNWRLALALVLNALAWLAALAFVIWL